MNCTTSDTSMTQAWATQLCSTQGGVDNSAELMSAVSSAAVGKPTPDCSYGYCSSSSVAVAASASATSVSSTSVSSATATAVNASTASSRATLLLLVLSPFIFLSMLL